MLTNVATIMTPAIAPTATPVAMPPSCFLRREDDSKDRSFPSENLGGAGVTLAVAKNENVSTSNYIASL